MKKIGKRIVGVLLLSSAIAVLMYLNRASILTWWEEEQAERDAWEAYTQRTQEKNTLEVEEMEAAGAAKKQLCLLIPKTVNPEEILISNNYLTQTIQIEFPHVDGDYFTGHPISGKSDKIEGISYLQGKESDWIQIELDAVYELDTSYDEEYYYFDFLKPHEVYEKVVVIDAGHGGRDPGANRKGILEKNIDLGITLELKKLLDVSEENIGVYYTRIDDSNPTNGERVGLANKSNADLFISIHINSYKGNRDSSINGTEVMYSSKQEGSFNSKQLASICMEELTSKLGSRDRGLITGDNIYIINKSKVPVALVEVGFITNKEERELLNSQEYQEKTAEALYDAIIRALGEQ